MSLKRKLLGLVLFASLATAAFVVVTASANQKGHFATGVDIAEIFGTENTTHTVEFSVENWGSTGVICNSTKWEETTSAKLENSITFFPKFSGCRTTGGIVDSVKINSNGCALLLFAAEGTTESTEQTGQIDCAGGKPIEIVHGSCTITISAQAISTGITYTKITFNFKKAITADFNAKITVKPDGSCGSATTVGKITGSMTLHAALPKSSSIDYEVT